MSTTEKKALAIVFNGVEEVEALATVDVLRRAGIATILASASNELSIEGRNGIRFQADQALASTDTSSFDAIFLPGGPGVFDLVDNPAIHSLLKTQASSGRLVSAICAAPKVLASAGLLRNRSATSHASVRDALPHPSDLPTVMDQGVLTSQGAGTAIDFALALAAELVGQEKAKEVADAIHAPPPSFPSA